MTGRAIILAVSLVGATFQFALADEDWSGVEVTGSTYFVSNPDGYYTGAPLPNTASVYMYCGTTLREDAGYALDTHDQTCPSTITYINDAGSEVTITSPTRGWFSVPISEFAMSSTVDALASSVDVLNTSISQMQSDLALVQAGYFELQTELNTQKFAIETIQIGLTKTLQIIDSESRRLDRVGAMSAVIHGPMPQQGKTQRLGGDVATYNGETAFGLSYTRVSGPLDFGVSYAQSGSENIGRVGAGISW